MEDKILVLGDEVNNKTIYYCGNVELEAFRRYKELPGNLFKKIVKAKVKMRKVLGVDFVEKYEIVERIK